MASKPSSYPVLDPVSQAYPEVQGRSPTCYSPVRHSSTEASFGLSVRLACVKHAASVHPEPGSNSPQKRFRKKQAVKSPNPTKNKPNTQHPKQASSDWQNPKITKVQTNPQPDGAQRRLAKKYVKHVQPHPTHTEPKKMTRSIIGIQPRHHRHTPTTGRTPHSAQNEAGKHTHATKVHWHTIEFSNNTRTPINPPQQ